MTLSIYDHQIVLQEVPNEVSISFSVAGCPLNCKGCSWKSIVGRMDKKELCDDTYLGILNDYKGLSTCVLFYGGEWDKNDLVKKLKQAMSLGYKTALYTGRTDIDKEIKENLTYLKVGPYIKELGALDNPNTNQKFYDLRSGELLNHHFWNKNPMERNVETTNTV